VPENERFVTPGIDANRGLPYLSPGLLEAYAGFLFYCYSRPYLPARTSSYARLAQRRGTTGQGLAYA
jgi:hypothetical protein